MQKRDTVIIGGGIIGLMSAYYLTKQGVRVTVIDKGPIHQASSHANCGLISPSHILPLNSFSLIFNSLGLMFKKDAPFRIKPQMDWKFISWFLGFVTNSTSAAINRSSEGRFQLLMSSAELYQQVIAEENIDCHWSEEGILFAFKKEKNFKAYEKTNEHSKKYKIEAQPIVGQELRDKEPALKDDVFGAWFYDVDNWLKPNEMIQEIKKVIEKNGSEIINETEVTGFQFENKQIRSVQTNNGEYEADKFLLAAGAWSPLMERSLGLKLPIIPGKGYSITMKSPSVRPKVPCIMMERKVVATPWEDTYRLGSTMEFVGYDETLNQVRLDALKRGAKEYMKEPYSDEVIEDWWGWRPMTYDGLPIIDQSPKHKNLWIAAGHSMLGMSMGTGTGKLVSELMLGEEPFLDSKMYAYDRF